jgi:MFS family permease
MQIISNKSLTLVIGVGIFTGCFGVYLVPFQIGALIDGLGFSQSQMGLLGAVEVGAMSLTAILISSKLGIWSMARVAMIGALIAGICEIFSGMVSTLPLFYPLRLCTGIGCGLIFGSVCAAAASTNNPDRVFGLGQALMNGLFLITFIFLPYSLGFGMQKGLFFTLGIILLLTTPLFKVLGRADSNVRVDSNEGTPKNRDLISLHIIATILLNVGLGAIWGFVERIGTQQVGLEAETVGMV